MVAAQSPSVTPLVCVGPKAWRSSLLGLVYWRSAQAGRQFQFRKWSAELQLCV